MFAGFLRAGDGNRTHVTSLEGWCSTIEPHLQSAQNRNRTSDTRIFSPLLYQLSYLGGYIRITRQQRTLYTLFDFFATFFYHKTLLIAETIFSIFMGLLICAFMPTFMAFCISSGRASAVIAIIGML